jgi:hypothetical protein
VGWGICWTEFGEHLERVAEFELAVFGVDVVGGAGPRSLSRHHFAYLRV